MAENKSLAFEVTHDPNLPSSLQTDQQRLQQVLKNLLSNAFKFTETGAVGAHLSLASKDVQFATRTLQEADQVIAFTITDTGIGIPEDKLRLVFEAFQQADGTTSRRFGGTGLGLSISREIARLLGGELQAISTVDEGSAFTFYLPVQYLPKADKPKTNLAPLEQKPEAQITADVSFVQELRAEVEMEHAMGEELEEETSFENRFDDDRDEINITDRSVMIIVDDERFTSRILRVAHNKNFKAIVTNSASEGFALVSQYHPDSIILDVELEDMAGMTLLSRLKRHPETRHIPVHIISAKDKKADALKAGAYAYIDKPVTAKQLEAEFDKMISFSEGTVKNLLVVEDNDAQRESIVELIGTGSDVSITAVGSADEALTALNAKQFDCVVLDLKLPKMTGFDLLEHIKQLDNYGDTPVIIYTGKDLTKAEEMRLKKYAQSIILKDAYSPERLLDETALFLHRVESDLPQARRKMLEHLHSNEEIFEDKKILIVDDDMRNVFSLTSVLERYKMNIIFAENGREAISMLDKNTDIDLVLMDLMMPEMDGYEAMQEIRKDKRFKDLPMIALTAKAMKGDREKSVSSGASDYITKPVKIEQLLSLMRVWLYN
jgi:CheY-like chemotaxis protein